MLFGKWFSKNSKTLPSIDTAYNLVNQGKLEEAKIAALSYLKKNNKNVSCLLLLGNIEAQTANYDTAEKYLNNAIELQPNSSDAYCFLGNVYRLKKELPQSIRYYERALKESPRHKLSIINLTQCYIETKRKTEALSLLNLAVSYGNDYQDFTELLAKLLLEKGDHHSVITLINNYIESHSGSLYAWSCLAIAYEKTGQLDHSIATYEKASELMPDSPQLHVNRALLQYRSRRFQDAEKSCKTALLNNDSLPEPYNVLGMIYEKNGKLTEAETSYRQALNIKPDFFDSQANLVSVHIKQGRLDEAYKICERANQDKWNNTGFSNNYLLSLNYRNHSEPDYVFKKHAEWWKVVSRRIEPRSCYPNRPTTRKLNMGYLSPDFNQHSVSYFMASILEWHNPKNFQVFCYSNSSITDHITQKIQSFNIVWRDIIWNSDDDVARKIQEDKIDILVDLAGHTSGNRLLVFAARPAPIQISYLGYPNTSGLDVIDYKITDSIADDRSNNQKYSETLVFLSKAFLTYTPPIHSPTINLSQNQTITFGSFNNIAKISDETISAWASVLIALPSSRLILKSSAFLDHNVRHDFLRRFKNKGIEASKVDLLGWDIKVKNHLEHYNNIDIALDTFPYNGTTTTFEALWMGVPVITLKGEVHASRVSASILSNLGYPELIANNEKEFIDISRLLASDPVKLLNIKKNLRRRLKNSPLMDYQSFTEDIERIYSKLWDDWCIKNR